MRNLLWASFSILNKILGLQEENIGLNPSNRASYDYFFYLVKRKLNALAIDSIQLYLAYKGVQ